MRSSEVVAADGSVSKWAGPGGLTGVVDAPVAHREAEPDGAPDCVIDLREGIGLRQGRHEAHGDAATLVTEVPALAPEGIEQDGYCQDTVARHCGWLLSYRPQQATRAVSLIKRAADLVFAVLALVVLAPLFLGCALAVWFGDRSAPIVFRQARTGRNGRRFGMYKFRTMVPDAEELKESLAHLNELEWPDFKITIDPRVTPVGRFLRRTSLDELPQILNVLLGHMSLVGPRPSGITPDQHQPWQLERLDVRPGLTGPWQVSTRATVDFADRCSLDIAYVRHHCLRADIGVLARTPRALFRGTGC